MKITIEEIQEIETEMLKYVIEICEKHQIDYFLSYGSVIGAVRHKGPIPWDDDADVAIPFPQIPRFLEKARKELPEKFYVDYYDTNPHYPSLFPRIGLKGYSSRRLHLDLYKLVGVSPEPEVQAKFKKKAHFYRTLFIYKNFNRHFFGKFTLKQTLFAPFVKLVLLPFSNRFILSQFDKMCDLYPYDTAEHVLNIAGLYGLKEIIPKSFLGKGTKLEYNGLQVNVPEKYHEYLTHFYGDYMQLPPEESRKIAPFYEISEL